MLDRTLTIYRNSFTGLSRQTWLLSFIMLINRSGTMVIPFMTLYLTSPEMGCTLGEAGTVMGLFGLGAIVGAYFGGRFSDRVGFYKVQLFTLFFGGAMFIVLGQVKSYPLICLCTFTLSLVNEAFRPANSTAIAYYSTAQNRTRSYSLNRFSINLGWAVGSSIGGLIASYNYQLLFWVDGLTNICAAGLLFYFLDPGAQARPSVKSNEESLRTSAYKDRIYLFFIVLVMLFAFCFFQLFTTIPNYLRDGLHLGERFIGFVMALNGVLIAAIEMVMIYYLEKRQTHIVAYIILGTLLCAVSYFSLLLPGHPKVIALIMIFFITIGEISSMPFMNTFWTSRSNAYNRGQYAALYTIAWGTAQTLGPFICSWLVEATSFYVMFIAMGLLSCFTAAGFMRLKQLT